MKIAVGPWFVCKLPRSVDDATTHLSLRGGVVHWVGDGEKWKAWSGTEREARDLARDHKGEAAPQRWLDEPPHRECPHKPKPHAHTRTGEPV